MDRSIWGKRCTPCLARPERTALEVLAANGVVTIIQLHDV